MPVILYIDTSANICTIALSQNNALLSMQQLNAFNEQAAIINIKIQEVIQGAGIALQDINAIAVCAGPGSYTGLRVALSTAKGLCFALDKPLMLFNKLMLVALQANVIKQQQIHLIALKARQDEFFVAAFDAEMNEIIAPAHIFQKDLALLMQSHNFDVIITDDITNELFQNKNIQPLLHEINMGKWIPIAEERYAQHTFDDIAYSEPFYLKQAFTTQPKNK